MKFHLLKRLLNFELRRSASHKSSDRCEENSIKVFQRVVKFEDCVIINKSFVVRNMETTSVKNQYFAALTGENS